jgi:N-acetylglucosaminyldiphosphoundecaprenol N-acetyl-beta-D-mannosaminyltransferase
MMNKTTLMGFPLSLGSYAEFVDGICDLAGRKTSAYVCVANVHMFVEASMDQKFSEIIEQASIVTPDGKPLTWALYATRGLRQERAAGMDLLPELLNAAADRGLRVYFYGSTPEVLARTREFMERHHPTTAIAGMYSPPFRPLTADEEADVAETINHSGAHLVFVVLGCPKQELWMASMKGRVQATMIGVGGALPVLIGDQRRAPRWMQRAGLEWFYRLTQDPRRLFKRYFVTNTLFVCWTVRELVVRRLSGVRG